MGNMPIKKSSAHGWLLSYALLLPGLALGQQPMATAAQAPVRDSEFRSRLKAAAQLYEELEYEQALKALGKAKELATTDDERAEVSVYEGIVLADLGQRKQALKAFQEALSLRPDARLPVRVSPKVARDFEDVRGTVQSAPPEAVAKPSPSGAEDRPLLSSEQNASALVTSPASPPPLAAAGLQAAATPQEHTGPRIGPLPVALLGAGVLTASVGSYYALRSRSSIQNARDAHTVSAQSGHLEVARGQALGANILFGVAATAVTGAVITYFLGDSATNERGTP